MTNETIVSVFVHWLSERVLEESEEVDRAAVGYGYAGLSLTGKEANFSNSVIRCLWTPVTRRRLMFNPGGFEAGGAGQGLYANKYMPNISNILTKVVKSHTLKGGFFWEWIRNAQPANNNTNGFLQFHTPPATRPS